VRFSPFARGVAALLAVAVGIAGVMVAVQSWQGCPKASLSDAVRLRVEPRADNVLIADAAVQLNQPAAVFLEYGNSQVGWLRTPTMNTGTNHQQPILRLRADTTYQVRAFTLNEAGCPTGAAVADLRTGTLPERLRSYEVQTTGQASFPFMLMDFPSPAPFLPPGAPGDRSRYLGAIDPDGQVVWYYLVPREFPVPPPEGSAYPIIRRPNGNLLYIAAYYGLEEITPDARVVQTMHFEQPAAARAHHEVLELPDGRLLYLGAEDRPIDDGRNGGPRDLVVRGDTLHALDPATRAQEQIWSAFGSLDPTDRLPEWEGWKIQGVLDWGHANAMSLGARGNVLISFRHTDQIISLAPDLRTIEWKLGGPGSDFKFADPGDRFRGQHSLNELPNGRILVFDNGNYKPEGEYSRALELELDFGTMTARRVWEYRHQPDIFSDKVSNALRLANGNTFVNFGFRVAPDEPVLSVEARPDGSVAWQQELKFRGMRGVRYRAYPSSSLAGEAPVEPTPANLQ
jgi:hypothetical protein